MNEIFQRTSVREFKPDKVEKEKIQMLLKAAMAAPSACNQQPWEFIVVENKDSLKYLSDVNPYAKLLESAPLGIVVLANTTGSVCPEYWQQDLSAATQNMLLEAVSIGLGGVWMGVAPGEDRMKFVADYFNLESNLQVFAIVAFGYPAKTPNAKNKFNDSKIHYERYTG